eukprot:297841-Rhodomonas_salina.8
MAYCIALCQYWTWRRRIRITTGTATGNTSTGASSTYCDTSSVGAGQRYRTSRSKAVGRYQGPRESLEVGSGYCCDHVRPRRAYARSVPHIA